MKKYQHPNCEMIQMLTSDIITESPASRFTTDTEGTGNIVSLQDAFL